MNKIIFALFLANCISWDSMNLFDTSCIAESNHEKCSSHTINFKGFTCIKGAISSITQCFVLPESSEGKKYYYQIQNGFYMETIAGTDGLISKTKPDENPISGKMELNVNGQKINYDMTHTITESHLAVAHTKNTCFYHFTGRFYDYVSLHPEQIGTYLNITDPNICYKATSFDELKDLVDCGIANITVVTDAGRVSLRTCGFIANDNLPEELERYMKSVLIDIDVKAGLNSLLFGYVSLDNSNLRYLDSNSNYKYEMTVESKNGKIVKYKSDEDEVELIANPNEKKKNSGNSIKNLNMFKIVILLLGLYF